MGVNARVRQTPQTSRSRGLPPLGFEFGAGDLEVTPVAAGPVVVRCSERMADGRTVGELEVGVLAKSLVIDRDGVLAAAASDAAGTTAHPITLPCATGYRAAAVTRAALPYIFVLAIAPEGGIEGGLLVTIRSAGPEWPAADRVIESLVILTRNGRAPTPVNDGSSGDPPGS
jgi:hypothetical protein